MRVCGDYCQVKRFQAMQADVKASLSESDSPVVEHAEPAAKTAAKRFRQTVTTVWYVCECVCVGSPLVVECWGVVTVHHDRSMHLEALPPAAVTLLRVASLLGPNNIPGVYALVLVNWCRMLDAADAVGPLHQSLCLWVALGWMKRRVSMTHWRQRCGHAPSTLQTLMVPASRGHGVWRSC